MIKSSKRDKSPTLQSSNDKSPWTHLHERKNLLNKSSMDKFPWTRLHKRKNLLNKSSKGKMFWTNLQRKNLLNKSSNDKFPWTHLHKREKKKKNLLNKSSKDKSPWTHLHENEKSLEKIFKMKNLHEQISKNKRWNFFFKGLQKSFKVFLLKRKFKSKKKRERKITHLKLVEH